jgi:hypothetical protein
MLIVLQVKYFKKEIKKLSNKDDKKLKMEEEQESQLYQQFKILY